MAPKKKQQKKNSSTPKTQISSSSGPRLQISAENESRLRRLLLNSGLSTGACAAPVDESLSKAQKAKKLKSIYENLSCEGFSNDQIELALSALKVFSVFLILLDPFPYLVTTLRNQLKRHSRCVLLAHWKLC